MTAAHDKWRTRGFLSMVVLAGLLAIACSTTEPPAEPGDTTDPLGSAAVPVNVSINAVMVDLIDHASHEIWDATGDPNSAPKADADWGLLEHHATQLAVSGSLITLGGTGPADYGWTQQTNWKKYSAELSAAGAAARDAVRARDLASLSNAGDQLIATCEGCHKEFKPESPTEGIIHRHDEYHLKK